jgi:hypothetical protein
MEGSIGQHPVCGVRIQEQPDVLRISDLMMEEHLMGYLFLSANETSTLCCMCFSSSYQSGT